jgi:BirA family biotin operon repressor/biotin-[acetyl-CoA-carboxylase] ligase
MDEPSDAIAPADPTAALDLGLIEHALTASLLPFNLRYFPTLDSTNTYAMQLASGAAQEGLVIITDHQFAGRGRMGRAWEGFPRRQLTFTIVLAPPFPAYWLMMASALSVQEAIGAVTGLTAAIKWPNDVLVGGKKVCGILIETSGDVAVVGVGVNVNGSLAQRLELAERATTLQDETGVLLSREALAAEILLTFARHYAAMRACGAAGRAAVRAAWRERLMTLGRDVRVAQGATHVSGWAEDVESDGALVVRQPNGERTIIRWGDVEIAR